MKVEQLYTGCLAQGAYYIESNGEAAIIDPLREVQQYIDMANERGAKIKYIFETHFHADFVSGHVDLSKKTGAPIVFGPTTMETGYEVTIAEDEQVFELGKVKIKLLHTPGHTTESSSYLLIDENGKETSLFSGDTLFIGDVGRPDLAQKVIADLTQDKLASMLYDSLRNKIMPLNDDIIVYPGHGAGSACGKNMSSETTDLLGNQKKTNYALNPELTREEFIKEVTTGLTPPPGYFPQNVLLNISGYEEVDKVVEKGCKALNVEEFEAIREQGEVKVLDTRDGSDFAKGFIEGSYNIGVEGSFASWVGTIYQDVNQPLLLIIEEGKQEEVATRLARIGFDNTLGYLKGGVEAWEAAGKSLETISSISIDTFKGQENPNVLDVRKESEYLSEHLVGAQNAPLDYYMDQLPIIDKDKHYYVHCAGGYRSMIFVSILQSFGYDNLTNIEGGFDNMKDVEGLERTEYVCPTTLL